MRRIHSIVAVIAAGTLAFAACGGDDDKPIDAAEGSDDESDDSNTTADDSDDTETTEDTTQETSDEPDDGEDLSPFAREFAEGFASTAGFDLPDDEIQCLADGVLDEFSFSELSELGESGETPGPDMIARVGPLFDDCISTDTLVTLFVDQGIPEDAATCMSETIAFSDLMAAGLDPESTQAAAMQEQVLDCM